MKNKVDYAKLIKVMLISKRIKIPTSKNRAVIHTVKDELCNSFLKSKISLRMILRIVCKNQDHTGFDMEPLQDQAITRVNQHKDPTPEGGDESYFYIY